MDIGERKTTLNIDYVMGLDLFQSLVSIKYMNKLHSSILSYNPSRLNPIINSGKHNVPSPPNILVIISKLSF